MAAPLPQVVLVIEPTWPMPVMRATRVGRSGSVGKTGGCGGEDCELGDIVGGK